MFSSISDICEIFEINTESLKVFKLILFFIKNINKAPSFSRRAVYHFQYFLHCRHSVVRNCKKCLKFIVHHSVASSHSTSFSKYILCWLVHKFYSSYCEILAADSQPSLHSWNLCRNGPLLSEIPLNLLNFFYPIYSKYLTQH